jgi:prepilin-type N-terminal cleavage/methylation domain-containing protein
MRRPNGSERGFTLVELMVAMLGGLFVSIAAFSLAKQASGFSMRQSRAADATLQNVVGFERLKADIARAGFLSSPNVVRDHAVCRDAATYPSMLEELASVRIEQLAVDERSKEMTVNQIAPYRILLSGSYSSEDQFIARNIVDASPTQIFLAPNSLGMVNIGYPLAQTTETLAKVFATGRVIRIQDDEGRVQFATIAGAAGGAAPSLTLAASPTVLFRSGSAQHCGVSGHGKNSINVVNLIRYDLRDVKNDATLPQLSYMFQGEPSYKGSDRRELVREELDATGNLLGTPEIVAEYAVDLGFSLLVAPNTTGGLVRLTGDTMKPYSGAAADWTATTGPQLIRAVNAWLSVRSEEADRATTLDLGRGSGPNLLRMSLDDADRTKPPFARVRTLQSTIPLHNQSRATWQ